MKFSITAATLFALGLPAFSAAASCSICKLVDDEVLKEKWGMRPTPLPGNFFTMDKYDDGLITTGMEEYYPYANETWYQDFFDNTTSSFPAMVRVQSLRQANVEEVLHFLPANAVWTYNGGCSSEFLIIRRDLSYEWVTLGPNADQGEVFSVFIAAGEYYLHINGPHGSAFMTSTIAPGFNSGADIITPLLPDVLADLNVTVEAGELYELVMNHSEPVPVLMDTDENNATLAPEADVEVAKREDDKDVAILAEEAPEEIAAGEFCQLLDDELLKESLGMMPTPLPGNFFTMDKYDDGLITMDLYPWANATWFKDFFDESTSSFPAMVRVQSLRQAGVEEVLHFLPGHAVWAYNGGYPSKFLIIRRDLSHEWVTIGPDAENGEVLSVFIGAGEYYAHKNGDGSAFMTSTIAPGFNTGADIITPTVSVVLEDLGVAMESDPDLYDLIVANSAPDEEELEVEGAVQQPELEAEAMDAEEEGPSERQATPSEQGEEYNFASAATHVVLEYACGLVGFLALAFSV